MAKRSLNRSDVRAWVLKGNPAIYDAVSAMDANVAFDSWRLYPSYRLELIAEDDRVVLWLTGAERGLYAAGRVTGDLFVSEGGTRFWRDLQEKRKVQPTLRSREPCTNPTYLRRQPNRRCSIPEC